MYCLSRYSVQYAAVLYNDKMLINPVNVGLRRRGGPRRRLNAVMLQLQHQILQQLQLAAAAALAVTLAAVLSGGAQAADTNYTFLRSQYIVVGVNLNRGGSMCVGPRCSAACDLAGKPNWFFRARR